MSAEHGLEVSTVVDTVSLSEALMVALDLALDLISLLTAGTMIHHLYGHSW